jgi:RsmE family RNA methyltransferase
MNKQTIRRVKHIFLKIITKVAVFVKFLEEILSKTSKKLVFRLCKAYIVRMHHFICTATINGAQLIIQDARVLHQLQHVLRMKPWSQIVIQILNGQSRYIVSINSIDRHQILTQIMSEQIAPTKIYHNILCVAYPNQISKLELIIQKTTEIWIDMIYRFDADRSQSHSLSINKQHRCQLIALEASEQSHRWDLPEIHYDCRLEDLIQQYAQDAIIFEQSDIREIPDHRSDESSAQLVWFVWPEGWRSDRELAIFQTNHIPLIWLWDTVLRMETAAIIWAWKITQKMSEDSQEMIQRMPWK